MRAETIIGGVGPPTTITSTCSSLTAVTKIPIRRALLLFSPARSSCFIASTTRRSPTRANNSAICSCARTGTGWPLRRALIRGAGKRRALGRRVHHGCGMVGTLGFAHPTLSSLPGATPLPQEGDKQFAHLFRLLLLNPMAGAVQQVKANHLGAGRA